MALVPIWSVYWPTADKLGPDPALMDRVVEVDEEVARQRAGSPGFPGDGTARYPTDEELAAWEESKALDDKAAEAAADGDLTALRKDELLAMLSDEQRAELPPRATKADIAEMVEQSRSQQEPAGVEGTGRPALVTDADGDDVGGGM
jgi:hypothetical protein